MSDIGSVHSYASAGLRLWSQFNTTHGHKCGCLICADTRAYLGKPPLIGSQEPAAQREERAAS